MKEIWSIIRDRSRNSKRRFPMMVDPKCRGLGCSPQPLKRFWFSNKVKFYVAILYWTIPGLTNTAKTVASGI